MERFFCYCPNCDIFETHKTAEDAAESADEHLDLCFRDRAFEGWSDEVDGLCWGEIKATAQETDRRPYDPENDHGVETPCEYIVDYGLRPILDPEQSPMAA